MAPISVLALLTSALYLPFLSNALVFDDLSLFSGIQFADYASSPLGLGRRWPAYWSIASVQVLWGSIQAHRLVSLVLHVACAWAIYGLVRELQRDRVGNSRLPAFAAALAFAVHPVAVYGAGYLQQRSIVLATLFGVLSITVFASGLRRGSYRPALVAALLFSLAVLSKEHTILLPAVAASVVLLKRPLERFSLRYGALYLAACIPAALLMVLIVKGAIGVRYEPEFEAVTAQIPAESWAGVQGSPWLGSVITQAGLFFRYLALWLAPHTSAMSLDLRIAFSDTWTPLVAFSAVAGFLAYGIIAGVLALRGGRLGLIGFGLLYPWLLFFLEFSVGRFQEPFVLYRSYLWTPGLAVVVAAALGRLPARSLAALVLVGAPLLAFQSYDRLRSLASPLAAWEDAAAKLPDTPVPGGWRTLHNLGREYLYAGAPEKAAVVIDRCRAQYPGAFYCLYARAAIRMQGGDYAGALPEIERAIAADPSRASTRHLLGVALEELGCASEARVEYEAAAQLGSGAARFRLESMDHPGKGLVVPKKPRTRSAVCATLGAKSRPG